ncbi:hypothetical protein SNE40_000256 [Patella caerulea]|uniref:TIR domain-containing protein n=1 Tax=Patella caerulea TaxID=87958 RepID=A0AAN8KDG0_PATCE
MDIYKFILGVIFLLDAVFSREIHLNSNGRASNNASSGLPKANQDETSRIHDGRTSDNASSGLPKANQDETSRIPDGRTSDNASSGLPKANKDETSRIPDGRTSDNASSGLPKANQDETSRIPDGRTSAKSSSGLPKANQDKTSRVPGVLMDSYYACGDNMCYCKDNVAVCSGHQHLLTYIPKLPSKIKQLTFSNNFLPHIKYNTLSNVSSLTHLYLKANNLTFCSPVAFRNLTELQILGIYQEKKITCGLLYYCLMGVISPKFQELQLIRLTFIGRSRKTYFFSALRNSPVSRVIMNSTYIDYYNHTDFAQLKNITVLCLRTCWIDNMQFSLNPKLIPKPNPKPIPTLTELVLSENALVNFPKFCVYDKTMFPNLKRLYMDNNFIRFMPKWGLDCMKHLEIFSISANPLHGLESNTFSRLPNLHTVFINDNSGSSFRIRNYAFNSSSLLNLYLKGNANHAQHLYEDALNCCANLESLDLSENHLYNQSNDYLNELFATLTNLKILKLSNTGIGSLPSAIVRRMPNLESLDVSYNHISWWTDDYFRNLKSLRTLNLASNQIATINQNSFSYGTLQDLSELDLSYNPYSCSCANLLWFARLLKTKGFTKKLRVFPNKYTCSTPSDWRGARIIDTPISDRFCLLTPVISLIITSVSIGLLLLLLAISLVYRYRWHLRYFVYILRYHHIRLMRFASEGRSYQYDIYLSCSEEDVDFILENVLPRLEHELNLRVFLPQRDGIGNKIDSIIENMDASRRFILCVSNTFTVDHYCEFEASVAYERILSERRNLLIVILLEELGVVNVTKTIHKILKDNDYIKWGLSEESIELFWLKLIQHLNVSDEPRS